MRPGNHASLLHDLGDWIRDLMSGLMKVADTAMH
jgi:hypothetical protein